MLTGVTKPILALPTVEADFAIFKPTRAPRKSTKTPGPTAASVRIKF